MDLGEPFKHEMRIEPGEEGTFIVYVNERPHREGVCFGFTTIDDLLIWMAKHGAKADPRQPGVTELSEGDVVRAGREAAACAPYAFQKANSVQGCISGEGIRRTTAAEIITEREYRNTARAAAAEKHAAQRNAPVFGNAQSDAAEAWSGADKPTNAA